MLSVAVTGRHRFAGDVASLRAVMTMLVADLVQRLGEQPAPELRLAPVLEAGSIAERFDAGRLHEIAQRLLAAHEPTGLQAHERHQRGQVLHEQGVEGARVPVACLRESA